MGPEPENPDMWINPKYNLGGGTYSNAFGEGQSTHNSRFLELADVAMAVKKPVKKEVMMAAAGAASSDSAHRQNS
jgi:hypothetical protein